MDTIWVGEGYNSQNLKMHAPIAIKGSVLLLSEYFLSVGYLDEDCVCAPEEEVEDGGLVFTKIDGRGATRWTEIEIPEVTLIKK